MKPKNGEKIHCSKLKDGDIIFIKELWDEGYNQSEIGKIFSVARSTIGRVVRNENWKHVQ